MSFSQDEPVRRRVIELDKKQRERGKKSFPSKQSLLFIVVGRAYGSNDRALWDVLRASKHVRERQTVRALNVCFASGM